MKQKKIIFLSILILLILTSCKQGFIKKVKIKASPQVKVNLGSKEVKVENFIDKKSVEDKIKTMGAGLDNVKVYEYGGADNTLHYLIHYPVDAKQIDMSEHITKIKTFTENNPDQNITAQTITIPEIKIEKSHTLSSAGIPANPTGGDITLELPIENFTPLNASGGNFISAKIAAGNLNISVSGVNGVPNTVKIDYTGIKLKYNTTDSKNFTNKTDSNVQGELDLSGLTLTPSDPITIEGSIKITGTIPANYTGSGALTLNITSDIKEFEKITIEKTLDVDYTVNQAINQDLKDLVDWIEFKTISADIELTNNLPKGNDITINIDSTIGNDTHTFKTKGENNTEKHKMLEKNNYRLNLAELSGLNFTAKLGLSGYDSSANPKTLTLKNIKNNTEYSLRGKISVNFDWNKACIKPKAPNNSIQNNFPTSPMTLNIFQNNDILSKLAPKPAAVYIYLNSDLIKKEYKPEIQTNVKLKYKPETSTSMTDINIINQDTAQEVAFVDTRPNFSATSSYEDLLKKASFSNDNIPIKDIFENKAKEIQFTAKADLKKIIVTKDALDKINKKEGSDKDKAEFNTDIVLDIQADAKTTGDITKEVISLPDILSRKEANNSNNDIINKIKDIELVINYNNKLGINLTAEIYNPDWKENGIPQFKKTIELKSGINEVKIKISKKEIEKIQKELFPIKIEFRLKNGSNQKLIKDGTINFSAYTVTNMDITYEF